MMNFDSNMMSGGDGSALLFSSWLVYILVIILLILGIAALWKYIQK